MRSPVSRKALLQRLRRFLKSRGEELRLANSDRRKQLGLGRYYTVGDKGVLDKDVNIEALARELKLLEPWERLK
jgi:hypothetical protein